MKTKVITAFLAVFMLAMTACGTISPPIQTVETTTIPITAESLDSAVSSEVESTVNNEQVKSDTFIAEFFDSNISFEDTSELVTESMKGCAFENETDNFNGVNKVTLKGKNGGGIINVLCVDLSQSQLDYDMKYILENFGDYYFGQTSAQMNGVTEDDFVSNYRMTTNVYYETRVVPIGSRTTFDITLANSWHSRGLRIMPVDNYCVFYIPDAEYAVITIIRVMYGGRDIDAQLKKYTNQKL